eukprot:TRINITY_DN2659_c1_g2_i1.p1 TRINITY_DN2659_c1_g2~~TRINITY_DN2659_c1_g2_i1.p1  ORF type:complete len:64 (-),score=9.30 TRINITY_DN2659_c1_g2_i1:105-296(-)
MQGPTEGHHRIIAANVLALILRGGKQETQQTPHCLPVCNNHMPTGGASMTRRGSLSTAAEGGV